MILRKYRYIIIIAFLFLPVSLFSQFTYIDISVGNKFMRHTKERYNGVRSTYNQTNIQLNGLYRFARHFGVGVSASIPVRQGGQYTIIGENGVGFNKYSLDPSRYEFDYYFKESVKGAINGRVYAGTRANFYVDGRISFFSMTENLMSTKFGFNYREENKFNQFAPGFSVGLQPHLGKKMTMNINMGFDFYKFKDVGFKNAGPSEKYAIPYEYSYQDLSYFKSQVPDKKAAFSINIGFGYFF